MPLTILLPNGQTAPPQRSGCGIDRAAEIIAAAGAILAQGEALLAALDDASYARRVPAVFNGSIGGHYRHCLDHFASFFRALDAAAEVVDYDHRERDVRLETDRAFAFEVTRALRTRVLGLAPGALTRRVRAQCEVNYGETQAPVTSSTLGREMAYLVAHAIHHYALMGVVANLLAVPLPDGFGVAPSTLKHLEQLRSAAGTEEAS
jgi:uncharacterized damage-inducible protein DinB